jgi:hypothetical protein
MSKTIYIDKILNCIRKNERKMENLCHKKLDIILLKNVLKLFQDKPDQQLIEYMQVYKRIIDEIVNRTNNTDLQMCSLWLEKIIELEGDSDVESDNDDNNNNKILNKLFLKSIRKRK